MSALVSGLEGFFMNQRLNEEVGLQSGVGTDDDLVDQGELAVFLWVQRRSCGDSAVVPQKTE